MVRNIFEEFQRILRNNFFFYHYDKVHFIEYYFLLLLLKLDNKLLLKRF